MASVRPTTTPTATAAPMIAAVRITMVRVRRCLAGAIATPAGCEAAMPPAWVGSAAAVPTGFCGAGCACVCRGAVCSCSCGEAGTDELCDCGAALCGNAGGCDFARVVPGLSGNGGAAVCCAATEAAIPHKNPSKAMLRNPRSSRFFHSCMDTPRPQVKDISWRLSDR